MFELRYLPPHNQTDGTVTPRVDNVIDRENVVFTKLGPLVKLTQKTWMLVPWSRVTAVSSSKSDLLEIAELQQ